MVPPATKRSRKFIFIYVYIFHTHALRVNEALQNPTVQKKKEHKREEEEEAHGGEAVDGMETAAQREATWNRTVHSFDSQVLALRKRKTKKKWKRKKT